MDCTPSNTAAIILAAGSSGRMGIPKSLLKMPDGATFLEQAVSAYLETGIRQVVVVVNPTVHKVLEYRKPWFFDDVKFIMNNQQEKGRLFSIMLGLEALEDCQFAFVHNVDQPFTTAELIGQMMKKAEKGSYVVPAYEGNSGHPVLLEADVIAAVIKHCADCKDLRTIIQPFYKNVVHTQNPLVCENINTPDDYRRVFGVMPG